VKPRLTVGILSNNRLHYLRALIESFATCYGREDFEFILVDNASTEAGLQDYVASLDFFAQRLVEPCTMVEALNQIVALARADVILMLPDDLQFNLHGVPWIEAGLDLLARHPQIGTITFDAQRRPTLRKYFGGLRGWLARARYHDPATGLTLRSYGPQRPGISGAGINSFTRKEVWERLGPWRSRKELETFMDSGVGSEADMLLRYRKMRLRLERCILPVPAAADIVTDSGGFPAKVRQGQRLGRYFPPPSGQFYYEMNGPAEAARLAAIRPLPAFEDAVRPIGFTLPFDESGELVKGNPVAGESEVSAL
jgi:hypothetical protein